jgi:hypothetical protein
VRPWPVTVAVNSGVIGIFICILFSTVGCMCMGVGVVFICMCVCVGVYVYVWVCVCGGFMCV